MASKGVTTCFYDEKRKLLKNKNKDKELDAKGSKQTKIRNVDGRLVKLPDILYHGTNFIAAKLIVLEGLKAGQPAGHITKEYGYEGSTDMFVSTAKNEKDAIFFANANQGFGWGKTPPPQVIIHINTSKLNPAKITARPLFDKPNSEFLYLGDMPDNAIKAIGLRTFSLDKNGLKVTEKVYTPKQFKELEL